MATQPSKTTPQSVLPTRFLAIDEEGYFLLDGMRVSDEATGRDWLSRLRMDDRGRPFFLDETESPRPSRVLIEAFDQPLIALEVTIHESLTAETTTLPARFPYGFETEIRTDSFRVDEWDRFYARTIDGVPVVLSRSAQSRLFQAATDFDDDSITFGDATFATRPLYEELPDIAQSDWWSELYRTGDTRWDSGGPHHLMDLLIPPMKLTRLRVLVLGCGAGHDAAWWEKRGHIVTGVDFSDEALSRARELYGESETLRWVKGDVFQLPQNWTSRFDVIFENTMFCAVPPERREDLVRTWWRLLSPRGRVVGFALVMDKLFGPPYGTSEWELRQRLLEAPARSANRTASHLRRPRFHPLLWKREQNSVEKRLGHELFFAVERADSLTE